METEIQQLNEYHGIRIRLSLTDPNKFAETLGWCNKQFGNPSRRWFLKGSYIYFKNEEDLTWYLLKWC